MSPDPLREQLSFLDEVDLDAPSSRPEGRPRSSNWRARVLTGAFLSAQVAVLGVFLHSWGIVQIRGLPPLDATATAAAPTMPTVALREPSATEVTPSPPATRAGGPSGTSAGGQPQSDAPSESDLARAMAVQTPEANPDDFPALPLRKEDEGVGPGPVEDASPVPEATLTENGKETGNAEQGDLPPLGEARLEKIRKKQLAQKYKDEANRQRRMFAMRQEAELYRYQREMIRRNTPRRTIRRDPNGQFMGATEDYPNGSRVDYDRNGQVRQLDLVLPDGTRYSIGRDGYGCWRW
jgi:hypothetical protein